MLTEKTGSFSSRYPDSQLSCFSEITRWLLRSPDNKLHHILPRKSDDIFNSQVIIVKWRMFSRVNELIFIWCCFSNCTELLLRLVTSGRHLLFCGSDINNVWKLNVLSSENRGNDVWNVSVQGFRSRDVAQWFELSVTVWTLRRSH